MLVLCVAPARPDDWTDPVGSGSEGVGAVLKVGWDYFVHNYRGIDLLWWNRR